jgi:hypothetical protein
MKLLKALLHKIDRRLDWISEKYLLKRYYAKIRSISPQPAPNSGPASKTAQRSITVVLNGFKRPQNLRTQVDAINQQTTRAQTVMLWQNHGTEFDEDITSALIYSKNNYNFGVWARFAFALNARTEYVCVFDDDTIPGKKWLSNCLETMSAVDGLLGTIGVVFLNGSSYSPHVRVGWSSPNEKTERVDIVGHSWFFRREWLSYFWRELPPIESSPLVGEDIHFSAMLQRHAGIGTYVPPHPPNDFEMWGSLPNHADRLGTDGASISMGEGNLGRMDSALKYEIARGFRPIVEPTGRE